MEQQYYDLSTFLKMFYLDCNIPIYLYDGQKVAFCMPKQDTFTYPPEKYVEQLWQQDSLITYVSSENGIFYGGLRIKNYAQAYLVLGPVCDIPFGDSEVHCLLKDYIVPSDLRSQFRAFLQQIPPVSLHPLLTKLFFLNYCLNLEETTLSDFFSEHLIEEPSNAQKVYEKKSDAPYNRSYEIEEVITNCIRTGNPDGFKAITLNPNALNIGINGPTPLRQLKNNLIISTTLATRAAIEGGLDYDTAYQISDEYIRLAESSTSADELNRLLMDVNVQFAQKVYEQRIPLSSNDIMTKAIRYVQQNINQPIHVEDVASYVGFSRSYFSVFFKKELGFSISAFILRCRLEESRRLLRYTSKSLSDISSYLCFSSQSHFQTAFKQQYKLTPLQYRNSTPTEKATKPI